jgi:uncharacterized protein (DUF952 family)
MRFVRIFHVATLDDWQQAQASGSYTTSTYGASLADVGFIHAARREQVSQVLARHYAEVTEPLVRLEIETDLLESPWREEAVGDETFPHVRGPLNTSAVVGTRPARLPPLEVAASAPGPPLPVLVVAFRGLALTLGVAAVTLLFAGAIADTRVGDGDLARSAEFLVWTLMATAATAGAAALGLAETIRLRARRH